MSRRSEPAPLPVRVRTVNGRLHFGTDAWAECSWCGARRDPGQFSACPVCQAFGADAEHEHRAALAAWAFDYHIDSIH